MIKLKVLACALFLFNLSTICSDKSAESLKFSIGTGATVEQKMQHPETRHSAGSFARHSDPLNAARKKNYQRMKRSQREAQQRRDAVDMSDAMFAKQLLAYKIAQQCMNEQAQKADYSKALLTAIAMAGVTLVGLSLARDIGTEMSAAQQNAALAQVSFYAEMQEGHDDGFTPCVAQTTM